LSAGSVDERRSGGGAPVEQPQRQPEIVVHHGVAVGRRRRRDGAEMDHRIELASVEPPGQVGRRNDVGKLALLQVAPLAVRTEPVVDDDIGAPRVVEVCNHVRPDETCSAGHQQHLRLPVFRLLSVGCMRGPRPGKRVEAS
jgi:hypothetical protein